MIDGEVLGIGWDGVEQRGAAFIRAGWEALRLGGDSIDIRHYELFCVCADS